MKWVLSLSWTPFMCFNLSRLFQHDNRGEFNYWDRRGRGRGSGFRGSFRSRGSFRGRGGFYRKASRDYRKGELDSEYYILPRHRDSQSVCIRLFWERDFCLWWLWLGLCSIRLCLTIRSGWRGRLSLRFHGHVWLMSIQDPCPLNLTSRAIAQTVLLVSLFVFQSFMAADKFFLWSWGTIFLDPAIQWSWWSDLCMMPEFPCQRSLQPTFGQLMLYL